MKHDGVTCQRLILDYLISYEDRTMSEDERSELRQHFERCPPCLRFLTTYEATGKTLRMLKPREIPPDLANAVIAFVRNRRGKPD
jgi:hypothetical protein